MTRDVRTPYLGAAVTVVDDLTAASWEAEIIELEAQDGRGAFVRRLDGNGAFPEWYVPYRMIRVR